jgi:hypothetical protein
MVSPSIYSPLDDSRISTGRDSPTLPLCNKDAKVQAREPKNMIENNQSCIPLFINELQAVNSGICLGLENILKCGKEFADTARSYLPSGGNFLPL